MFLVYKDVNIFSDNASFISVFKHNEENNFAELVQNQKDLKLLEAVILKKRPRIVICSIVRH